MCHLPVYLSGLIPFLVAAAIALWTATGDEDHIYIVGSHIHYSVPGCCLDLTSVTCLPVCLPGLVLFLVAAAIALWTATGDEDHIYIVGSYL
jgi:type IV secretory pathway TrbD component